MASSCQPRPPRPVIMWHRAKLFSVPRVTSVVLWCGGGHPPDDLSDDLSHADKTQKDLMEILLLQRKYHHPNNDKLAVCSIYVPGLYFTFLLMRLPSWSKKCSSVMDSPGIFFASSPCKRSPLANF